MSSSCISGGGRAAIRALDLEIIKSPSSNSWLSNSSSPSSTLSESSNSPLAISTRKPRTPRKRPNQTYNEAAAILSTAHPKIFPTKHLTKFAKPYVDVGTNNNKNPFLFEPNSDLLMLPFQVFDTSGFLLQHPPIIERTHRCSIEPKGGSNNLFEKQCQSPGEITSYGNSDICNDYEEDFDAESILDEEIEEGILDSIMGNLDAANEQTLGGKFIDDTLQVNNNNNNFCYGYPVGLGFDYGNGMRRETSAIRHVDEGDWWRFPSVNLVDITPKIAQVPLENKKKKKKKKMVEIKNLEDPIANKRLNTDNNNTEECAPKPNVGLNLKLNYDGVLNAWSDKASPFSGDSPVAESAGNDVQARLAQIDLFSDNGGREAIVLRYKEKRRTRLFSKKIRYQVRKVNADRRPRMKGRFVRSPNSPDNEQG